MTVKSKRILWVLGLIVVTYIVLVVRTGGTESPFLRLHPQVMREFQGMQ